MLKRDSTSYRRVIKRLFALLACLTTGVPATCLYAQVVEAESRSICYTPGNIGLVSVETNQVMLTWADPNGASLWELEVRTGNQPFFGTPTHLANSNPFLLTNLNPATRYRLRIRAICNGGAEKSGWTFIPFSFTTASLNPTSCGGYFTIDDDNCPVENVVYIQVDDPGGDSLGQNISLAAVDVVISHTFLADLHLTLVSPSGQAVNLFDQHGQSRNHLGNPADPGCQQVCRFSSTECGAIDPVEHTSAFIGTFLPDEHLAGFDDGSDPEGIWQLRICDDAKADTGSLRYLKLVFANLNCAPAYDLTVGALTPTSAQLNWTFAGTCSDLILEYGPPGFQPGTDGGAGQGQVVILPCGAGESHVLENLSPSTPYELYARTSCGGGAYSANSCPVAFTTDCEINQPVSDLLDVDDLPACGANCFCGIDYPLNSFWENRTEGDDFDWLVREGPATVDLQTGPFSDVSGNGRYLYLETLNSACQKGAEAVLQSGCMVVMDTPGEVCHLSFYYHMWGLGMGDLLVEASQDGGIQWTSLWMESGNQGSNWHKAYVDLSPFSGDTIQLRFRGVSGPLRTSQMAIDEVALYGVELLGEPDILVYADLDADGYGDPDAPFFTCSSVVPSGYSANAQDCNDQDPMIHPGAAEVICNQVDENCNGMEDDSQAPLPVIGNRLICAGQSILLEVESMPLGQIYWYDLPAGGNPIHVGATFQTPSLNQSVTYYLVDSSALFPCASNRKPVQIQVASQPELVIGPFTGMCQGDSLDLTDLPIVDLGLSSAVFSYHSQSPATPANVLPDPVVAPVQSTAYTILAETAQGCRDELTVPVAVWSVPKVDIVNPDPLILCAGESALLQAVVSGGGSAPFSFSWSNGFNQFYTTVLAGNSPGMKTYHVSVSDSHGCDASDHVEVMTLEGTPSLTISTMNVSTCGGTNGSVTIQPSGPGSFDYSWSGPVSGSTSGHSGPLVINGLKQGNYTLVVTNSLTGCSSGPVSFIVNGPGPTIDQLTISPESCVGFDDGAIDMELSGPVNSIAWSHGPTTEDVADLTPGDYQVTITGGGCSITLQQLTIQPAVPIVIGGLVQDIACHGMASGMIDLAVTGGAGGYTYLWSSGSDQEDPGSLPVGSYQVTVTDQAGCTQKSDPFQIAQPQPLLSNYQIQDVSCHGEADGSIQLLITGGQGPYQVVWSDQVQSKDRTMLMPGTYGCTITDQAGCTFVLGGLVIQQPPALMLSWGVVKPETCAGAKDGLLSTLVTGGQAPYAYQWSFGIGMGVSSSLGTGTYAVTVSDMNGCTAALPDLFLDLLDPLQVEVAHLIDPTCDFLADGQLSLEVSGGSGNYDYDWSTGDVGSVLMNVPSGNYSVTVTDLLGCTQSLSGLVLQETSPLHINLVGIQYSACGLNSLGSIDIAISGQGPFSYLWQNGLTIEDPQNVPPGFYSVSVSDANNCQAVLTGIAVSNTGQNFKADLVEREDVVCYGKGNGSLTVQVEGGESPFQFNWSSGQEKDLSVPLDQVQGLGAGNYTVTITDNRGCVLVYGPMTIMEPGPLDLAIPFSEIHNETCFGAKDGSISLLINGGTSPYKTFWFRDSVAYSSVQSPKNLSPGRYTVLVVDDNGCSRSLAQEVEIFGPPSLLTIQSVSVMSDDCSEALTGEIELKISGGVPEYGYLWSDNSTLKNRVNLAPGTYCVTVEDEFHCRQDTCIQVPGGSTLVMVTTVIDECDPFSSIYTNTGGGTPPYAFKWSNGSTQEELVNVATGAYSLTITDAQGCSLIESNIPVGYPAVEIEQLYSVPASPGMANGMAVVVPGGGTPPFAIQWDVNASGQQTDTAFMLLPNTYCVQVTDIHNCVDTGCVEVYLTTASEEVDGADLSFVIIPNPATGFFQVVSKQLENQGRPIRWSLRTMAGEVVLEKTSDRFPVTISVEGLSPGLYMLIGQDGMSRSFFRPVVIH